MSRTPNLRWNQVARFYDLPRIDTGNRDEPLPMPGRIPWGIRCHAALFLHADGATPADEVSVFSRTVFNIAGNKHRIVVWINYPIGLAGTASTSC